MPVALKELIRNKKKGDRVDHWSKDRKKREGGMEANRIWATTTQPGPVYYSNLSSAAIEWGSSTDDMSVSRTDD